MHHKIKAENTNSNTEKCSPGCPAYFHTVTTIPESHVTTSPKQWRPDRVDRVDKV